MKTRRHGLPILICGVTLVVIPHKDAVFVAENAWQRQMKWATCTAQSHRLADAETLKPRANANRRLRLRETRTACGV